MQLLGLRSRDLGRAMILIAAASRQQSYAKPDIDERPYPPWQLIEEDPSRPARPAEDVKPVLRFRAWPLRRKLGILRWTSGYAGFADSLLLRDARCLRGYHLARYQSTA